METRKIIGYLTPIDLFGGLVKKGRMYIQSRNNINEYVLYTDSEIEELCEMPKEIVTTWKAIYEEEKYTKDEWLYFEYDKTNFGIFRYYKIDENGNHSTKEGYHVAYGEIEISADCSNYANKKDVRKATDEQIQNILSIVAISKGIKFGSKIKFSSLSNKPHTIVNYNNNKIRYWVDEWRNGLYFNSCLIYSNKIKQWAEIIPIVKLPEGYTDNGDKTITFYGDRESHSFDWWLGYHEGLDKNEFYIKEIKQVKEYIEANN